MTPTDVLTVTLNVPVPPARTVPMFQETVPLVKVVGTVRLAIVAVAVAVVPPAFGAPIVIVGAEV